MNYQIALKSPFIDDLNLITTVIIAGKGIALLAMFVRYAEAQNEKRVQVFSDWCSDEQPEHFVHPAQNLNEKRLGAFIVTGSNISRENLNQNIFRKPIGDQPLIN